MTLLEFLPKIFKSNVVVNGTAQIKGALTLGSTALTATAAEINKLAGVIAGTVAASKALVVDANKDLAQLRNMRAVRSIHDGGAPASINTVGAGAYSAAQLLTGIIVRDPNGASRTDTLDTAANIVAALPGATVGDTLTVTVINGSDAAEVITLAVPASGGFDANQTAASRVIGQNSSKTLRIRLTNVTALSEAYVVYA